MEFYSLHWEEKSQALYSRRGKPSTVRIHGVMAIFGWHDRPPGEPLQTLGANISFVLEFQVYEAQTNYLQIIKHSTKVTTFELQKTAP